MPPGPIPLRRSPTGGGIPALTGNGAAVKRPTRLTGSRQTVPRPDGGGYKGKGAGSEEGGGGAERGRGLVGGEPTGKGNAGAGRGGA